MSSKRLQSALISVYHKEGLDEILAELDRLNIKIYSTGGTEKFIRQKGYEVHTVENLTSYPSILDGRVKTLHPKVFGGILARREENHIAQLDQYEIPEIDLVIVDLYPFEETVRATEDESAIIEKIDIGGIALIRAAAKNYKDVVVVPSKNEYAYLRDLLNEKDGLTDLEDRKHLASRAFAVSSNYDSAIFSWFNRDDHSSDLRISFQSRTPLRYGENPHQSASFYGDLDNQFEKIQGKDISYNNLVDIDAAVQLMAEFEKDDPTMVVMKHTNSCGVATRNSVLEAWHAALAGDPVSAFGGILIANRPIDLDTAREINKIFFEVLIAPGFTEEALEEFSAKKKRILLRIKSFKRQPYGVKTVLNGLVRQDTDQKMETPEDLKPATALNPDEDTIQELVFANKVVKHLKSNTVVISKNRQLLGMGCGQTSRVDALHQAIDKAGRMGFDVKGAVLASDAFFPFPDCVEIAFNNGIMDVIQPGGSIKDKLSIDFCNDHGMRMVFTGTRHFKH